MASVEPANELMHTGPLPSDDASATPDPIPTAGRTRSHADYSRAQVLSLLPRLTTYPGLGSLCVPSRAVADAIECVQCHREGARLMGLRVREVS
jgi:hypothetical protein